jgi:6-phosphogluconolactonase
MGNKGSINIFDTEGELDTAVAQFIVKKATEAIRSKGKFSLVLSGGNTPRGLYTLLSAQIYSSLIQWESVYIFWADERCVALDDESNNAQMAKTLLLNKVNIPAVNIYRIPSDIDPTKAARIYEDNIRFFFKGQFPSFDLILLGLGENGHTASLFPYTQAQYAASRLITQVHVKEQEMYRITMTSFLINMAHHILFLVSGADKSEILDQIINGPFDADKYPAQTINPHNGDLNWYLDKAAAQSLEKAR